MKINLSFVCLYKFGTCRKVKNGYGFTLIELIVVITILAVLATIGVAVFSTVQKNNRDQQRLRDLTAIKQQMELSRSESRCYPSGDNQFGVFLINWSQDNMNKKALDPLMSYSSLQGYRGDRFYRYQSGPSACLCPGSGNISACTSFVVCAKKEGSNSFPVPETCKNMVCSGSFSTTSLIPDIPDNECIASPGSDSCCDMGLSSD